MKDALFLVPGLIFGLGLAISGMNNPAKVIGFLDVTGGAWDPSLALVMLGAIATFAPLNILIHRRAAALYGGPLPGARSTTGVSPRLVIGAAIFGAGWGLSGVCPGPAIADVGTLRGEVLVYLAAMIAGMVLAQRGFGADAPGGHPPAVTPPEASSAPASSPGA